MAFESIPLSWETLSIVVGAATTGATAGWQIARALRKGQLHELAARLHVFVQRSEFLSDDLDKERSRSGNLEQLLAQKNDLLKKLEGDLVLDNGARKTLEELTKRVKNFDDLRAALLGGEDEVWKLRDSRPPSEFRTRMQNSRTKVITVINYKGGVGKTTLVAGLSAYLAARRKRVCVIDFDYQGSLTRTLILGTRLSLSGIRADRVIGGEIDARQFVELGRDLGAKMPNAVLITCGHSFDRFEFRTMLQWLLGETKDDVRFRLANLILGEEVQKEYDYVLIDAPPRASTGAINALFASHALIVPTVLDALSVDAVGAFLVRTNSFRSLNPALDYVGIVPTLTAVTNLNEPEKKALNDVERARQLWEGRSHVFKNRIRHFTALSRAAGRDVGYLEDRLVRRAFDALGDELMGELHEDGPTPSNARIHGSHSRGERSGAESGITPSL